MPCGQFQEMLQKLASAYDHLYAEKEALQEELKILRKSDVAAANLGQGVGANDGKQSITKLDSRMNPLLQNLDFSDSCDGRLTGEPLEANEYIGPVGLTAPLHGNDAATDDLSKLTTKRRSEVSKPTSARSDLLKLTLHPPPLKAMSNKDRPIYEQYERLRWDPETNHEDMLTAADLVLTASEYVPLLELEEATTALRHFMIHACDLKEEDIDLKISSDAGRATLQSKSDRQILRVARSLGIPFQAFLSFVTLDTSKLEEMQVLEDYIITLSVLRQGLTGEEERHTSEKKETFTHLVETVSAIVICSNAFALGLHAGSGESIWFGLESGFTAYYICEIALKMTTHGCTWYFFGAQWRWNYYDLVVIVIGAVDVVIEGSLRIHGHAQEYWKIQGIGAVVILARLARLVRLLRFKIFADLKTMVIGVVTGLQILFWAVVLLALFVYAVALLMRTRLSHDTNVDNGCSADDGTPLQVKLAEDFGLWFMLSYVFVFLFVTIGIFNLIMANFVDYVSTANGRRSQEERGSNALEMQNQLKDILVGLTSQIEGWPPRTSFAGNTCQILRDWFDRLIHPRSFFQARASRMNKRFDFCSTKKVNTSGMMIRRHEFAQWIQDPKFLKCLNKLEIETSNKAELFDVLDYDASGVLSFEDIVHGLMHMRGPPQKSDIIAALLGVRHIVAAVGDIRAILETVIPQESGVPPSVGAENAIVKNTTLKLNNNKGASGLNMEKTSSFPEVGAKAGVPAVGAVTEAYSL